MCHCGQRSVALCIVSRREHRPVRLSGECDPYPGHSGLVPERGSAFRSSESENRPGCTLGRFMCRGLAYKRSIT